MLTTDSMCRPPGPEAGGQLSMSDPSLWPRSVPRAAAVVSVSWDLIAAIRSAVGRHASSWRWRATRIRVSDMTDNWMHSHQIEYDKHPSDLL